jgi:hypothetical protein
MGEAKGPFGGSFHSSASVEDVWAVWTNPAEWPGENTSWGLLMGGNRVGCCPGVGGALANNLKATNSHVQLATRKALRQNKV